MSKMLLLSKSVTFLPIPAIPGRDVKIDVPVRWEMLSNMVHKGFKYNTKKKICALKNDVCAVV